MKNFKVQSSELMVTMAVYQRLDWAQQLESAPSCSLTERNIMKNFKVQSKGLSLTTAVNQGPKQSKLTSSDSNN